MAKRGINKVTLIGNIGKDPEVRYTPSGDAVTNLTLATSETWKDKQGQQQEKTEWHKVSIWGKLAEIAGEYVKKGSKLYIEGKLETRKWQDNDGNDRYSTEVKVDSFDGVMQMLDSKTGGVTPQQQAPQQAPQQQYQAPQQQAAQQAYQAPVQQAPVQQAPQQRPAPVPQDSQQGMQSNDWDDNIPF